MINFHRKNQSLPPSGQAVPGRDSRVHSHGIPQPLLPLKKRAYRLGFVQPQPVRYRGRGRPKYRYRSLIAILHPEEAAVAPPLPPPPPPPPLPPPPSPPTSPLFEDLNGVGGGGDGGDQRMASSSSEEVDLAKFVFKWGKTGRRGLGEPDEKYQPVVHEDAVGYKCRPSLKKLLYEFYGWDEEAATSSSVDADAVDEEDEDDDDNDEYYHDYVNWHKLLNP